MFAASFDNFCVYTMSDIQTEIGGTLLIWVEFSSFSFFRINKNTNTSKIISQQRYVRSPGDVGEKLFEQKTNGKIVEKI